MRFERPRESLGKMSKSVINLIVAKDGALQLGEWRQGHRLDAVLDLIGNPQSEGRPIGHLVSGRNATVSPATAERWPRTSHFIAFVARSSDGSFQLQESLGVFLYVKFREAWHHRRFDEHLAEAETFVVAPKLPES